jgi:hypothetical protein
MGVAAGVEKWKEGLKKRRKLKSLFRLGRGALKSA